MRGKTAKAALAGALAAIIAAPAVPLAEKLFGGPDVDVSVVRAQAGEVDVVHTETDASGTRKDTKLPTAGVEVTLKNGGEDPAVIVEARLSVLTVDRVRACKPVGGDIQSTGTYGVSLPGSAASGDSYQGQVQFEVAPHDADALTVTVGAKEPLVHGAPLSLYRVHLQVREAGSSDFIDVPGEYSLGVMPSAADGLKYDTCMKRRAHKAVRAFLDGHGSDTITPTLRGILHAANSS
ncbi:hypothetical protein [Streptomyces boluensis]|uniref:Secreted protein n=1 Tax=Streptomyces boluensis TaxID=1775135 RepID=A0A964XK57_9ACTN|nr:hypothetical protein [Streptomyces boluensis]NBE50362.1 hypothetical protein [Streptomyces boluensis]